LFLNRAIIVERELENDLYTFSIDMIFEEIDRTILFYLKKPIHLKLIKMFFANMRISMEPRISSSLQDKPIEFNCQKLVDILGIYNYGPNFYEKKIIPIIKGFIYDEAIIIYTSRHDFSLGIKIKSQDLLLDFCT
jgi:hypothetical protein